MPEYLRPIHLPKTKPIKNPACIAAWSQSHQRCMNPYCRSGWKLETHHIIKHGRSDEPCNFLRLCQQCHNLAGNLDVRGRDSKLLPKLSLANCLWIKFTAEPEQYDGQRLQVLRCSRLPDPEPPEPPG